MSVQIRRRREAASFLSTYVGAQGELIIDTTSNRLQVHDGTTPGGWPAAKLADVIGRTAIADASYQALASDRTIAFTALTAARTVTLPAASAYPTGTQLLVVDESGGCSFTSAITIARSGTDTIGGAASAVVNAPYAFLALTSNGASKWTIVDFIGATTAQLTNRNALLNGNFAINQRGYASGGTLAANAYAHDRWKAGAGGCAYTFTQAIPDTSVTITSGSLIQAVEAANVAAAAWWLTWTGTATARVWQGSPSGTYSAGLAMTIGGVAVNALLVTGLTVGTLAAFEFTAGSLGLVQLEAALPNAGPTRFERRMGELALCQRYYQTNGYLYGFAATASSVVVTVPLFAIMRASQTVSLLTTSPRIESPPFSQAFTGSGSAVTSAHTSSLGSGFDCTINGFSGLTVGNVMSMPTNQIAISVEL